jgi:hypothetical protein
MRCSQNGSFRDGLIRRQAQYFRGVPAISIAGDFEAAVRPASAQVHAQQAFEAGLVRHSGGPAEAGAEIDAMQRGTTACLEIRL